MGNPSLPLQPKESRKKFTNKQNKIIEGHEMKVNLIKCNAPLSITTPSYYFYDDGFVDLDDFKKIVKKLDKIINSTNIDKLKIGIYPNIEPGTVDKITLESHDNTFDNTILNDICNFFRSVYCFTSSDRNKICRSMLHKPKI